MNSDLEQLAERHLLREVLCFTDHVPVTDTRTQPEQGHWPLSNLLVIARLSNRPGAHGAVPEGTHA